MTKRLKRSFLCFLCGSLILSATACKSHTDTGESSLFSDSRIEEMSSMDQQESVFNTEQTSSNAVSSEKTNTSRPVANNSSQPRPEQEESGKNRPLVYLLFEFRSVYYGDQTQMNWNDMVRFYTSLQGRPMVVPRLIPETEEEKAEFEAGKKRSDLRKQPRLENY